MNDVTSFTQSFIAGLKATTPVEFVAVIAGIAGVFLERAEKIWLYPVGLISTVLYTYISIRGSLYGEASVNVFYTVMSIYGWVLWAKRNRQNQPALHITFSSKKEWKMHLLFFTAVYVTMFCCLTYLKKFFPGALPGIDSFTAACAFTGMLLLARKKVATWYWWIVTNTCSIPLYFIKGYAFTSVQFLVFTVLSVAGLIAWRKKASAASGH